MNEIVYTKEATYRFNYNGDTNYEYHFVDNILNMRFRGTTDEITNFLPGALNIPATNEPHRIIDAVLVGERVFFEDEQGQKFAELLFLLPDINYYMQVEYRKEYEFYFEEWSTLWGTKLTVDLIKSQENH